MPLRTITYRTTKHRSEVARLEPMVEESKGDYHWTLGDSDDCHLGLWIIRDRNNRRSDNGRADHRRADFGTVRRHVDARAHGGSN